MTGAVRSSGRGAVLLVHPGAGRPGGVSVDVGNLAERLSTQDLRTIVAGSPGEVRRGVVAQPETIVHVFGCTPSVTIPAAMTIAKIARRPLVWTPIFHPNRPTSWTGSGLRRVMELFDRTVPRVAPVADAVIAATEEEADHFRSLGARRVEVIPPGVSMRDAPDTAAVHAFRERVRLGNSGTVLIASREGGRKGLAFGLAAFAEVRRRRPETELLLVGPEGRPDDDPDDGIRRPGWLAPPDMRLAFAAAGVLFVPSRYEGFPRVVIEAWSLGTPVVATDRIGLAPRVSETGNWVIRSGDIDAAADALLRCLDDTGLGAERGERGRSWVERSCELDAVARRTRELYEDLVPSTRRLARAQPVHREALGA